MCFELLSPLPDVPFELCLEAEDILWWEVDVVEDNSDDAVDDDEEDNVEDLGINS